MSRPSFVKWATSRGGLYLFDKKEPTLAHFPDYFKDIFNHIFPGGDGQLPYSQIAWSAPKKSGKSQIAAGAHIWYALFVDVPGEQYVLANDLQGSRARVFRAILGALDKNPLLKRGQHWDHTATEITFDNGSVIRAIPADSRGEAGGNQSLATIDEPWGIIHKGGERLMTEFVPVPTRANSTIFYTGYQGFEGQSNFWHDLIDTGMGEAVAELAHLDDGDGKPACWRNGRLFVYWDHKPRMAWHTDAYIEDRRRTMHPGEFARTWENRRVSSTEAFCTAEQWDALMDVGLRGLMPGDERQIVIAVDAATKADCTALVACGYNAEERRVEVLHSRAWHPPASGAIQLTETIGPEIVRLHRDYRVAAVLYDPFQMAAIAEMCRRAGVRMVEFPQTARRVQADTHLYQLIVGKNLAHYGDVTLREHITNAMTKSTERGQRLVKELSSAKIDAAVALSMAALGAVEALAGERAIMTTAKNLFYGEM